MRGSKNLSTSWVSFQRKYGHNKLYLWIKFLLIEYNFCMSFCGMANKLLNWRTLSFLDTAKQSKANKLLNWRTLSFLDPAKQSKALQSRNHFQKLLVCGYDKIDPIYPYFYSYEIKRLFSGQQLKIAFNRFFVISFLYLQTHQVAKSHSCCF